MADINNLLALPGKERRRIAERLWQSLSPVNVISSEDEEILDLLNERWENIEKGNSKTYTSAQLKKMIEGERNKRK